MNDYSKVRGRVDTGRSSEKTSHILTGGGPSSDLQHCINRIAALQTRAHISEVSVRNDASGSPDGSPFSSPNRLASAAARRQPPGRPRTENGTSAAYGTPPRANMMLHNLSGRHGHRIDAGHSADPALCQSAPPHTDCVPGRRILDQTPERGRSAIAPPSPYHNDTGSTTSKARRKMSFSPTAASIHRKVSLELDSDSQEYETDDVEIVSCYGAPTGPASKTPSLKKSELQTVQESGGGVAPDPLGSPKPSAQKTLASFHSIPKSAGGKKGQLPLTPAQSPMPDLATPFQSPSPNLAGGQKYQLPLTPAQSTKPDSAIPFHCKAPHPFRAAEKRTYVQRAPQFLESNSEIPPSGTVLKTVHQLCFDDIDGNATNHADATADATNDDEANHTSHSPVAYAKEDANALAEKSNMLNTSVSWLVSKKDRFLGSRRKGKKSSFRRNFIPKKVANVVSRALSSRRKLFSARLTTRKNRKNSLPPEVPPATRNHHHVPPPTGNPLYHPPPPALLRRQPQTDNHGVDFPAKMGVGTGLLREAQVIRDSIDQLLSDRGNGITRAPDVVRSTTKCESIAVPRAPANGHAHALGAPNELVELATVQRLANNLLKVGRGKARADATSDNAAAHEADAVDVIIFDV